MPNNPDSVPKKPLKNQTINNNSQRSNKSPLHTRRKQFKDPLSQSSNILKEVENTRYHWLTTKQTQQRSTPILNQERQYGRVNLISAYRGESPPSRVRKEVLSSNSARTEHRGGLFNVHADNRTKAPYYIIHPEWLSETMTIRQLGLSPRPTPLPINNNNNYPHGDQARRRGHFTATCSEQHTTNTDTTCTDSVESSISRSRSLPPKAFNPITWNC
ncbi:unnamed protein product [Trichobilharzia szidati]|nr:unnamed protein product [Trichobilharzia szidati]